MYDPSLGGQQIHDFNPGNTQSGLFWTIVIESESVRVDLGAGTALYELRDAHPKDYITFENAILGNGPSPRPAVVSFKVQWTAIGPEQNFDNPAQKYRATMRNASAQMEWSARSDDYEFQSAPLASSTTDAAQLGQESNGSFY